MGSTADYTIIVMLVFIGVGLWSVLDRLGQVQRDVAELKRRSGIEEGEPPA